MTDTPKIPLILFSGGLDSTALLLDSLQDSDVDTLYVSSAQGEAKVAKELEARNAIFEVLRNDPSNKKYKVQKDYQFTLTQSATIREPMYSTVDREAHQDEQVGRRFRQVQLWLFAALQIVDPTRHSEVRMAYVVGDQTNFHLTELRQAWDNLKWLNGGDVPLKFPMIYRRKEELLDAIGPELETLIWTCEIPTSQGKACGLCAACVSLAKAKFGRSIMNRPVPPLAEIQGKSPKVEEENHG